MRKITLILIPLLMLAASCSFYYDPDTPGYMETRHEPLTDGTYFREGGRYTYFLDVENGADHYERASVLLSVYMDSVDGESLIKLGTFTGYIEHNELMYDDKLNGESVRIHRDDIVFTSYDGTDFLYDGEDLSGTYEIAYRGAKDISESDYGHVLVPVAGTLAYLDAVNGFGTDPDWDGMLSGIWEKRP